MAKLTIFSTSTFNVYKELSFVDKSLDIEKAKVVATAQLIRVLPTFTTTNVKIRKGDHVYDETILTWPTIKQFIKQGVLRITSADHVTYYQDEERRKEEAKRKKAEKKENKGENEDVKPPKKDPVKKETKARTPRKVKTLDDISDVD